MCVGQFFIGFQICFVDGEFGGGVCVIVIFENYDVCQGFVIVVGYMCIKFGEKCFVNMYLIFVDMMGNIIG